MIALLNQRRIWYAVDYGRDAPLTLRFTLVGARIEVDFFKDRVAYRAYTGQEVVEDDQEFLFTVIQSGMPDWGPAQIDAKAADARTLVRLLLRDEFRK